MRWRPPFKYALFILFVFLGDRIGGWLLERGFQSTRFRYAQLMSGDLPADLVFLGNSRGVHMFHRPAMEEQTGKKVANLAFNATPAVMLPVILEDYLMHHAPPAQIIVEVSCVGRENESGSLERFSILAGCSQSVLPTLREHRPRTYWFSRLSHLYRFNSELLLRSLFFLKESDQDWIMDSNVGSDWKQSLGEEGVPPLRENSVDAEALVRVRELCDQHDIQVTFVLGPYLPEYVEQLRSKEPWLSWLETQVGQRILDYSATTLPRDGFADPIHLNATGAEQLAKQMVERGDIPTAQQLSRPLQ